MLIKMVQLTDLDELHTLTASGSADAITGDPHSGSQARGIGDASARCRTELTYGSGSENHAMI
jgi:hypothetical protein